MDGAAPIQRVWPTTPAETQKLARCPTARLHVLERCLRRDQRPADVDVDHAVHLIERGLLEGFRNGRAGIVHEDVKSAEGRDGLFDRALDGVDVGSVRLDRDSLSTITFNRVDDRGSGGGLLCIRDGHIRSVRGQTFRDGCANASRTAGDECHLLV
jgi:hypothetical protein